MSRIALFPGTFDPVTLGHMDLIKRALPLVDRMYIGVGVNAEKTTMFPLSKRLQWLEGLYKTEPRIEVISYEGLTVKVCEKIGARYILRGVRTVKDFEYEKAISDMNGALAPDVETILLFATAEFATLASTLVRDVIRNGGEVSAFLPQMVLNDLNLGRYMEA